MKWIKASERLPDELGKVHWRDEITKEPISAGLAYKYAVSENKSDLVEWLDEGCTHEPLIDTGIGYYHCPACGNGFTYDEWNNHNKTKPEGGGLDEADILWELDQALLECSKGIIYDKNVFYPGNTFTPEQRCELKLEWLKQLGVWPIKTVKTEGGGLDEVIKEMENAANSAEECAESWKDNKDAYRDFSKEADVINTWLPRLKALARSEGEQGEWISVENRLPEAEGLYLAYVTEHPFLGPTECANVVYYGFGIDEDLTEMQWSLNMRDITVTHWRPLPKPPIKK